MKDKFELLKSYTYENIQLNDYKWLEQAIKESKHSKIESAIRNSISKNIKSVRDNEMSMEEAIEMVAFEVQNIMKK